MRWVGFKNIEFLFKIRANQLNGKYKNLITDSIEIHIKIEFGKTETRDFLQLFKMVAKNIVREL